MTFASKSFCQLIKCQPGKNKWQVLGDKRDRLWEEMNCWKGAGELTERGIGTWKEHSAEVSSQSIVMLVYLQQRATKT